MKGTAGDGKTLSENAFVKVGFSERGIGLQTVVLIPFAEEFSGATVYMDENEARVVVLQLERAIKESRRCR